MGALRPEGKKWRPKIRCEGVFWLMKAEDPLYAAAYLPLFWLLQEAHIVSISSAVQKAKDEKLISDHAWKTRP